MTGSCDPHDEPGDVLELPRYPQASDHHGSPGPLLALAEWSSAHAAELA